MHNKHNLSPVLVPATRFEQTWRPSRWQFAAQVLLGILAAVAVLHCALPLIWAVPLAIITLLIGLFQAWSQWHQSAQTVFIPLPPAHACINQQPLQSMQLIERGPLLILRWKAVKTTTYTSHGHLLFWPDTLSALQRRALRLAVRAHRPMR